MSVDHNTFTDFRNREDADCFVILFDYGTFTSSQAVWSAEYARNRVAAERGREFPPFGFWRVKGGAA